MKPTILGDRCAAAGLLLLGPLGWSKLGGLSGKEFLSLVYLRKDLGVSVAELSFRY